MRLLLLIPAMLVSFFAHAQVLAVEGVLASHTTWSIDTVLLTNSVFVPDTVTLTISPGVTVLAAEAAKLEVHGNLRAQGTNTAPILFSSVDTTGFSDTLTVAGSWGGLHLVSAELDSTILDHCIVEYGGAFGENDTDKAGGGIFIDQCTQVRISNSIIRNNFAQRSGGGIYMHTDTRAHIHNNLVMGNKTGLEGGGIMSTENCFPLIEENIVIENLALLCSAIGCTARGGGILVTTLSDSSVAVVRSNIVCNNFSIAGGGVYDSSFNTQVVSNIICNNFGDGIYVGNSISSSFYVNNTIVSNRGTGIWAFSPNTSLVNNIAYNNHDFVGPAFIDTVDINYDEDTAASNFLHNNAVSAFELGDAPGDADLTIFGNGDISVPPLFVAPSAGMGHRFNGYEADWSLLPEDAGINAGTTDGIAEMLPERDAYGNARIQGDAIDMGAIESDIISMVTDELAAGQNVKVYPNPFSGQVWLELTDKSTTLDTWTLFIWNEQGRLVTQRKVLNRLVLLDTMAWASGTYVLAGKRRDGTSLFSRRVVKH